MHGLRLPLRQSLNRIWQTPEVRALAPLALVAGLFAVFIQLADEVMEGETHGFDSTILLALRNADPADPIGPPSLEVVMSDLTALGGYTVLTLISSLAVVYLLIRRKASSAWLVAASAIGGMLLNHMLKTGFDRPRPTLVAHLAEIHTLSFPSGHAMLSAIIYLTLGALLARSQSSRAIKGYIMAAAISLTLLVGISRIYLGVHWPTDVLAGWCIGAAWALLCLQVLRHLTPDTRQSLRHAATASHK